MAAARNSALVYRFDINIISHLNIDLSQ